MRYFDTRLKCEVFEKNENTIESTDSKVEVFFKPLPVGMALEFNEEGLPSLIKKVSYTDEEISTYDKISECAQYLTSTDWYYARKMETGEEVPEDVVIKRKEARDFIRENEC